MRKVVVGHCHSSSGRQWRRRRWHFDQKPKTICRNGLFYRMKLIIVIIVRRSHQNDRSNVPANDRHRKCFVCNLSYSHRIRPELNCGCFTRFHALKNNATALWLYDDDDGGGVGDDDKSEQREPRSLESRQMIFAVIKSLAIFSPLFSPNYSISRFTV